jgi:hypothetical protein
MQEDGKTFTFRRNIGEPIQIAGKGGTILEVTPQAQALVIRGAYGGLVWNRPVAVLVRHAGQSDARPTRVPIPNITRTAQSILLSLSVIFAIISIVLSIKKSRPLWPPRRKPNG